MRSLCPAVTSVRAPSRPLRRRLTEEGCVYILFPKAPEAARVTSLTSRPGLGMLVAGTDTAVVPCFLDGAYRAFPPERAYPHFTPLRLRIGAPLHFADEPHRRVGWSRVAAAAE